MLVQKINRFEKASSSRETAELILLYTIVPKRRDLKELKEISKFAKASNWIPSVTPKQPKITISSKTPNSGISL